MKQYFILILLVLVMFNLLAFANITPNTVAPFTLYGGETYEQTYTITNDFSYDVNTVIDYNFWNTSGDLTGTTFSISENQPFTIHAYNSKDIKVKIETASNLFPEPYYYSLSATFYLIGQQVPIRTVTVTGGGGGGGGSSTIIVDRNVYVDHNIPVIKEVIKKVPKEVIKTVEVPVEKIVYKENSDKNSLLQPTGLTTMITNDKIGLRALVIALLVAVIVIIYFNFFKKNGGEKDESKNNNNRDNLDASISG